MGKTINSEKLIENSKKKQGRCYNCDETDLNVLEFAHIDRENKAKTKTGASYTRSLCSMPLHVIREELQKGRFLCVSCHRTETRKEDALRRESTLKALDERGSCCVSLDDDSEYFLCTGSKCVSRIRQKMFRFKNQKYCKLCEYSSKVDRYTKKQEYINNRKIEIGKCEFCNLKVTRETTHLFDFDHVANKNCNVSQLIWRCTDVIENEIQLCRLLCAKCHRVKTTAEMRARGLSLLQT